MQEKEKAGSCPSKLEEKRLSKVSDLVCETPKSRAITAASGQSIDIGINILLSSKELDSQAKQIIASATEIEPNQTNFYFSFLTGLGIYIEAARLNPKLLETSNVDLVKGFLNFSEKAIESFRYTQSKDNELLRTIISSPNILSPDVLKVLFDVYKKKLLLTEIEETIKQHPTEAWSTTYKKSLTVSRPITVDNQNDGKPQPSHNELPITRPVSRLIRVEPQNPIRNSESFRKLRKEFPLTHIYEDWVISYFLEKHSQYAAGRLHQLGDICAKENDSKGFPFFDNMTVRQMAILFQESYLPYLRNASRVFDEARKTYQLSKNPLVQNDNMLRIIVSREMYNTRHFIETNAPKFQSLINEFKDHQYIKSNINLLFYYFIQNPSDPRKNLLSDSELFLELKEKYQNDSFIYKVSEDSGDDFLRFTIKLSPQDPESAIERSKIYYQTLSENHPGNEILGDSLTEARIITAFFYSESSKNLERLIHNLQVAKHDVINSLPSTEIQEVMKRLTLVGIRCGNESLIAAKKAICSNPNTHISVPSKASMNHFLYPFFFNLEEIPTPKPKTQV